MPRSPSPLALPLFFALSVACGGENANAPPLRTATWGPTPGPAAPYVQSQDKTPDLAVVHRIKEEAYRRGQVMDHLFWLTDVNGSRLTASPGFRTAADWAVRTLSAWGVGSPRLEAWGPFGRAWSVQRFEIALVEPGGFARLHGAPKAWSRGTNGPVTAQLVAAPLFPDREDGDDWMDLAKLAQRIGAYRDAWRGKLKDRFVLIDPERDMRLPETPDPNRYDDKALGEMGQASEHLPPERWTWPLTRLPRDPKKRRALMASIPVDVVWDYYDRSDAVFRDLWRFLNEEGVKGILSTDTRGEGALVFVESTGQWQASLPLPPPSVVLAPEDYNRLVRLTEKKIPARVRLDAAIAASDKDEQGYNVVAELPGASKKDEIVMLGAHLDSWHAGTGATDNGAGCAVMMEAMRILRALGLPLERTVRLSLWSGEEQGLLGSRAYVKSHFADPVTMARSPEHEKLSIYLNLDNGSGKIRGVYLEENDMARPMFEAWLSPFKDEGVSTITLRKTFGTDHQSFDAVGLPGFQFVQDPLDYGSRTHHSNLDVYAHAQAGDLMQAAAIVATLVYEAANRADMFPRKPLPQALPPKISTPGQ